MKTNRYIVIIFLLSAAAVSISTYYSVNSSKLSNQLAKRVYLAQHQISRVDRIYTYVSNADNGVKNYIITGQEKSLIPSDSSYARLKRTFNMLKSEMKEDTALNKDVNTLELQANDRIAYMDKLTKERKKSFDSAQKMVLTGIGAIQTDSIKALVVRMNLKEQKERTEYITQTQASIDKTTHTIVVGGAVRFLIILIILLFVQRDLAKRIISEKTLKQSEKKFHDIFAYSPFAIVITNLETGKIQSANDEFTHLLGYTKEDIKNRSMIDIGAISAEERSKLVGELKVHGITKDREFSFRAKSGDVVTCLFSNIIIDIDDTPSIIALFSNITELKKVEEELVIAKEKAEESSRAKETFVANMSHEIRTPMNAILGFTDLLLKRDLQEPEKEKLRIIKSSGESLLHIINNVLDVSKIESGMMVFEEHPISIKELLSSLNSMLHLKAEQRNLKLSFQYEDKIPDIVLGDSTSLTGVIINLVNNAIKFTNPEGRVDVFAKMVDEKEEVYRVEFTIKDTGIGIPDDKIQHVFERFTQAETNITRKYGGTGLGLNIAKQLVELQGGKLTVESKVGLGSIFTFILPFKKTTQVLGTPKDTIEATVGKIDKLVVLIAEDNPINIKFVTTLFAEYNLIKPDIVKDGKEAVDKMRNNHYDLILMDIEMPEMNGYEATQAIRQDLKNNVPIIAMTAHAMAGEEEKCLKLGMNAFISKPIKANLLFEKMLTVTTKKTSKGIDITQKNKFLNLDFLIESMNGKKESILGIIDMSLEQIPDDIAVINEAVAKTDYATIKSRAHRMKSTISVLGISSISNILEEMHALGASENGIENIKTLNQALNFLGEQVMQEMQVEKLNYT